MSIRVNCTLSRTWCSGNSAVDIHTTNWNFSHAVWKKNTYFSLKRVRPNKTACHEGAWRGRVVTPFRLVFNGGEGSLPVPGEELKREGSLPTWTTYLMNYGIGSPPPPPGTEWQTPVKTLPALVLRTWLVIIDKIILIIDMLNRRSHQCSDW